MGALYSKAKEDRECSPGHRSIKFIPIERQAGQCKSTDAAIESEIRRKNGAGNFLDP